MCVCVCVYAGEAVPRDAFGHAKLDSVNVGKYYGDKLGALMGAEKVLCLS